MNDAPETIWAVHWNTEGMADPRVKALVDALEWYKKNMMMPSSQPAVEALAQLKEPKP